MDLFTFTTKTAYINSLSTIKELENELRNLHKTVNTSSYYLGNKKIDNSVNIEELARPFMLYTQCLKRFEEKSKQKLPGYLYDIRSIGATVILDVIVNKDLQVTYEQYIDIFKYMGTKDIVFPPASNNSKLDLKSGLGVVIKLAQIVGSNPNPYTLNYGRVTPSFLFSNLCYDNSVRASILQAIAIRQTMLNDKPYTVLEDFLKTTLQSTTETFDYNTEEIVNMSKILTSATVEYAGLENA